MALSPDQLAELHDGFRFHQSPQASAGQSHVQAWNFAILDFRECCNWEGIGYPSQEDAEAEVVRLLLAPAVS